MALSCGDRNAKALLGLCQPMISDHCLGLQVLKHTLRCKSMACGRSLPENAARPDPSRCTGNRGVGEDNAQNIESATGIAWRRLGPLVQEIGTGGDYPYGGGLPPWFVERRVAL